MFIPSVCIYLPVSTQPAGPQVPSWRESRALGSLLGSGSSCSACQLGGGLSFPPQGSCFLSYFGLPKHCQHRRPGDLGGNWPQPGLAGAWDLYMGSSACLPQAPLVAFRGFCMGRGQCRVRIWKRFLF